MPPYSFGQCEQPQPFLFRMRHQATISSLERWRPSTSLRRVSGGTLSLKKAPHFLTKRDFFLAESEIHRILL